MRASRQAAPLLLLAVLHLYLTQLGCACGGYTNVRFSGCSLEKEAVETRPLAWTSASCIAKKRILIPSWKRSISSQTRYCAQRFWSLHKSTRLLYPNSGTLAKDGFVITRARRFPNSPLNQSLLTRGICWQFMGCSYSNNQPAASQDRYVDVNPNLDVPQALFRLSSCTTTRDIIPALGEKFPKEAVPTKHQRPNIVFLLLDDGGIGDLNIPQYRRHVSGPAEYDTKHISNLSQSSIVFENAYVSAAVCAPSRAAIMSSRHASGSYIKGNAGNGRSFKLNSAKSMTKVMKEAEYNVGFAGKWGFCDNPLQHGIDLFFGMQTHRESHSFYPLKMYRYDANTKYGRYWSKRKLKPNFNLWKNRFVSQAKCSDGRMRCSHIEKQTQKQAIHMLDRFAKVSKRSYNSRPFFLFYSSFLPHAGSYTNGVRYSHHLVKAVDETIDCISQIQGAELMATMKNKARRSQVSECAHKTMMELYIDSFVGKIIKRLDYHGISDQTLFVLTSDNGPEKEFFHRSNVDIIHDPILWGSNGGGSGIKRSMYEGGIHVPLLLHWKGVTKTGRTSTRLTSLVDLLPTFAHLAGAHLVQGGDFVSRMQGLSLAPTLFSSATQLNHKALPSVFCLPSAMSSPGYEETSERTCRWALRRGNYKLVKEGSSELQLFNIQDDPLEEKPLSKSSHEDRFSSMQRLFMNEYHQPIKSIVDPLPLQYSCP